MRLDHINIKAPAALLEEVREFYCEVFGLREGFRPRFAGKGYWLYAEERALVHLSLAPDLRPSGAVAALDHVAFRAEGLDAFVSRLDRLGLDYRSSRVPELQLTQLFFDDPAGTRLEVNFADQAIS